MEIPSSPPSPSSPPLTDHDSPRYANREIDLWGNFSHTRHTDSHGPGNNGPRSLRTRGTRASLCAVVTNNASPQRVDCPFLGDGAVWSVVTMFLLLLLLLLVVLEKGISTRFLGEIGRLTESSRDCGIAWTLCLFFSSSALCM